MNERLNNIFHQNANEFYIRNELGKEQWIQVSGSKELNGAKAEFGVGLIDQDKIDSVFYDVAWDLDSKDGYPGFRYDDGEESVYYRNCSEDDGKEVLIFERDYYGLKPSTVEISEEFRLLNNLYYDKEENSYYSINKYGQSDLAVRIENQSIFIKLVYLMRYIAAKQKVLLLFFDIQFEIEGSLSENGLVEFSKNNIKEGDLYYSINGFDINNAKTYSRLIGKKIIKPREKKTCGYWPFEKEREYIDYIIGANEYGEAVYYNSNPNKLGNYFGGNTDAPHYLTPVFFKKEVLHKYISEPSKYTVSDGYLSCGYLWGVSIDTDHRDYVMVYLGDLGRDLPECEQDYWKSFNVLTDEKISKSSIMKDFMNVACSPEIADSKFKDLYLTVNDRWENKFGWPLFNPLTQNDKYNFDYLRIPLTNGQEEFDQQVLALNKVLIDSLNEKKIEMEIIIQDGMKGISKLEEWIKNKKIEGYEKHILFLRDLQKLRSTGTGHRKGKEYDKIALKFHLSESNKKADFERILLEAISFLEYMFSLSESVVQ